MIRFILNNKVIATEAKSGMTLLDFIRDNQHLKGTKIGCREGDCGACTVLVGTEENGAINYQSITSCISPLGNANGKHIVTVEGINLPEELNVVQTAMKDNYATQCGFCTPGFVVAMTGHALQDATKEASCENAISGNICRCTGYKSIEKATVTVEEKLVTKTDNNKIEWLIDNGFIPDYFATIPNKLATLEVEPLPKSGTLVANGTDLYVRSADLLSDQEVYLIGAESDLRFIKFENNTCTLGANTTVTDLMENERLNLIFPKLKSYLKLISSEQIRNMGTIAGNFVNASPIGDMSCFFLALNSILHIRNIIGAVEDFAFENFHIAYKKYNLQEGEIIHSLSFEIPNEQTSFNFEKVSKRTHLDIASVNTAASIEVANDKILSATISIGGVAAIPLVLSKTGAFLIGKSISNETVKEAAQVLQTEIAPISDVRGDEAYKRLLARQLFFAHFITNYPTKVSLQKLISK